ncbi:MAG: asparagine synthetase B family protein, partial [Rhodospirillales bacterium]
MCGIVALFSALPSAAPVSRDELLAIRDRMTARGPDGAGLWMAEDGRVGLGHRRLAIIDPDPRSNQPMADASGRFVITFNGEIYNFADLRGDLESQGVTFRTASDTEVLLELFARQGPAMAGRLAGMFALAIWDKVERRLTLMRDAFGIKPLYYALEGGVLRVASSVKALMAGGGLPRDPDPAGHAGFFVFGHLPEPHTLYRAVRALEPGTWFSLDADGTEKRGRFFSIRDRLMAPPPSSPPPDLRQALNESIDRHFVADVPVGVFLSAGRDSATVTA